MEVVPALSYPIPQHRLSGTEPVYAVLHALLKHIVCVVDGMQYLQILAWAVRESAHIIQ